MNQQENARQILRPPFPWFGTKHRIANVVWQALGDVDHYIEPFGGSLAVLLARPSHHRGQNETVNDIDGMIVNFWRSVAADPLTVARYADTPATEIDLIARYKYIQRVRENLTDQLKSDPEFYDAKVAGWWAWGVSTAIGSIYTCLSYVRPAKSMLPSGSKRGVHRRSIRSLADYFTQIAARLRNVVITCGDWRRVVTRGNLAGFRTVGVFLDPPYVHGNRELKLYTVDEDIASEVEAWAFEHGNDPKIRIVLACYGDERRLPEGWRSIHWTAKESYKSSTSAAVNRNRFRERLWLSPGCVYGVRELF